MLCSIFIVKRNSFNDPHTYDTLPSRTDPTYDKLGKIRPVLDCHSQFLTMYNPHCEVSIDEAMIAFKGRSSMKQYVPKKPVKL
jgi:hypothetical protein